MTDWEKIIIELFICHYFDSAPESDDDRSVLRVRSSSAFPNFFSSCTDEKESYLEAAESLQRKGIIKLNWEKRGKGERLKTLSCDNFEKLFEVIGRPYPKTESEKIRVMLSEKVQYLKKLPESKDIVQTERTIALLEYLSQHFSPREIGEGIDQHVMEDFIRLLEFCCTPALHEKITTRSLSILLYHNSKHLEYILKLFNPLLSRLQKNISIPDLTFLERSYPETMISGEIIIEYKNQKPPLINAGGHILGLPLESVKAIESIQLVLNVPAALEQKETVLTIENKETFYALARPQKENTSETLSKFDCFLYTGGYLNRAAAQVIKILGISGFTFYHAGDLDPDGILIFQQIQDAAGVTVIPLRMDAATFDQYQSWARPLNKSTLRQIEKIREETRAIPEIAGLLQRIEETGKGVEQEIIDYR